jgi:N-acetylmuramoyl-L-alanine amidase
VSVHQIQAIADRYVATGGIAVFTNGWAGRGNGMASQYEAGVFHHTAGGNNVNIDQILINGRSDLPGPLCNFCIMYDGDLGVIAAHPANHAGASGGWDTAPLQRTNLFNKLTIGTEIQYKGTEPMAPVQYESAKRLANAILFVLGKSGRYEFIKFHQGTSIQGKWDPGYDARGYTYDIGAFRRDCANMGQGESESGGDWMDNKLQLLGYP